METKKLVRDASALYPIEKRPLLRIDMLDFSLLFETSVMIDPDNTLNPLP
jgi:hypothetical protein